MTISILQSRRDKEMYFFLIGGYLTILNYVLFNKLTFTDDEIQRCTINSNLINYTNDSCHINSK